MLKPPPRADRDAGSVLLVDDDALLLKATRRLLEGLGYRVVACNGGEDALNRLDRETFDLVISNVQMPGFGGLRLLREMRLRGLDLPVVLMTGNPEVETAAAAIEHRAFQYLIKPVPAERLVEAVERALSANESTRGQQGDPRISNEVCPLEEASTDGVEQQRPSPKHLAFQPIAHASTSVIYGYEALLRGSSSDAPAPGVDHQALLLDHGRATRDRLAEAIAAASGDWTFVLKMGSKSISNPDIFDLTTDLSRCAGRVVLELSESASSQSSLELRERVGRLRNLGFRVALDLSAGYSALSSFAALEPELVKLDLTIVRDIHLSRAKQQVARSLVCLCHELGQVLLADGVANPDERAVLVGLGCDLLQGALIGEARAALPVTVFD